MPLAACVSRRVGRSREGHRDELIARQPPVRVVEWARRNGSAQPTAMYRTLPLSVDNGRSNPSRLTGIVKIWLGLSISS